MDRHSIAIPTPGTHVPVSRLDDISITNRALSPLLVLSGGLFVSRRGTCVLAAEVERPSTLNGNLFTAIAPVYDGNNGAQS